MTFEQLQYQRPDMAQFSARFHELLQRFSNAESFDLQSEAFTAINALRDEFSSMYNLCHIRHTVNTKDEFYAAENDFFDQEMPNVEALNFQFYEKLWHQHRS